MVLRAQWLGNNVTDLSCTDASPRQRLTGPPRAVQRRCQRFLHLGTYQPFRASTLAYTIFAASSPTPTEPEASASASHAVPPKPPLTLSTRVASSRPPPPTLVATVPAPVPVHVERGGASSQSPPGCVHSTSANIAATPGGTCDISVPRSAAAAAVDPDRRAPRAPSRRRDNGDGCTTRAVRVSFISFWFARSRSPVTIIERMGKMSPRRIFGSPRPIRNP